jgi:phosphoglycerate dehydrogenase-like enzyme
VVAPDGAGLPASAAEVEFYVPPFFPPPPSLTAMAGMPRLRVVQTLTAGFDRVRPHVPPGAVLCNARGAHDASTAEWVVGAAIAALRQFPYFATEQAAGRWSYRFTGTLAGTTVLIVGYGSIGQAVERRLAGFDVQVRRVARSARDGVVAISDLPALLPRADVVILLAPVTRETRGMVDAAFLARMKDGALLINAARGVLVVTDDLVTAVSTGRLAAALDVTDPEPLPAGHPLWALPNVFITPHVAASTPYSMLEANRLVRAQAERYLAGQPLENVIIGEY